VETQTAQRAMEPIKSVPSWLQQTVSDSLEQSIGSRSNVSINDATKAKVKNDERLKEACDDDDGDDDEHDNAVRQSMLPPNLQVSSPGRGKKPGLFRIGRKLRHGESMGTDTSVITNRPSTEVGENSSVASYMNGFSGNTVGSTATASSFRSKIRRMLSHSGPSEPNETAGSSSRPPVPRPPLRLTGKGMEKGLPPRPPRPPQPSKLVTASPVASSSPSPSPSPVQDPTPTHRSISTLDTEECTLEGGVPSVIYCFMKVNPHENDDDDMDLSGNHSAIGRLFHLPKTFSKHFIKRKSKVAKTHIDEDDEESYAQTLVAL
jgi:hypothetical protein